MAVCPVTMPSRGWANQMQPRDLSMDARRGGICRTGQNYDCIAWRMHWHQREERKNGHVEQKFRVLDNPAHRQQACLPWPEVDSLMQTFKPF